MVLEIRCGMICGFSMTWVHNIKHILEASLEKKAYLNPVNNTCKRDKVQLYLCTTQMELDIGALAQLVGDNATSEKFLKASRARHIAIDSILWNSEMEQWLDYWLPADADCQVLTNRSL